MAKPITFLSDYGHDDSFAGVCRAVIAGISPGATIIDLTHGIEPHDVRQGALVLAGSLPFAPAGVHLAVVDPGVGTKRRAVAVKAGDGRQLVGPDNGLLSLAIERLGGAAAAVEISDSPLRLDPVSATFHGRDLFAPVTAHLANGVALEEAGSMIDPSGLVRLELTSATVETGRVIAHVQYADRFGNLGLDLAADDLPATGLEAGGAFTAIAGAIERSGVLAETFGDVAEGELVLYGNAIGAMTLAVNRGSAAAELRIGPEDEVVLVPA
jgi:S-adenosyl-L-methionine hydrolase (adenosine-forming)